MIRVKFKKEEVVPEFELTVYDSFNRIPFSLKKKSYSVTPTTINARNFFNENLLEFSFDGTNAQLYEIDIISIEKSTVTFNAIPNFNVVKDEFYCCEIDEGNSELDNSINIRVSRDKNACLFYWNEPNTNIVYYPISNNCYLGIDSEFSLCSIALIALSESEIFSVFGF